MSEIKPKLILRTGTNISEKSPSPSTKLMLNHGKPNFTINRSKSKIDSQTPQPKTPEASQVVLKSTTFNGFIKPSNLNLSTENEVNKVVLRPTKLPEVNEKPPQEVEPEFMKVLRRTKQPETNGKSAQEDEPEFIKTQRKIAERLAKENNLDFESRKSGYFTHVMMSPTSPNKPMELPVIENGKIQKAVVLDASEAVEPTESADAEPTTNGDELVENGQTEESTRNGYQEEHEQEPQTEDEVEPQPDVAEVAKTLIEEVVKNASGEVSTQNGLQNGDSHNEENGCSTTALNVNFQPKTVVSFSKDLSSELNKYPDTVKVTQHADQNNADHGLLQEMSKLKFDISADSEDVTVTPVLRVAE